MDGVAAQAKGDLQEVMKGLLCYKMSGSGNDFVFVDGRLAPIDTWSAETIRGICARGTGVGADGFVVLEEGSDAGRVRFHFFNSDGGRAPMCGNGALCATRMAVILGLAPADAVDLETDAGTYHATCSESDERATLLLPSVTKIGQPPIPLTGGERSIHDIEMGVRHLVVVVDDAGRIDMQHRGRELRHHPAIGPHGANVNFVSTDGREWRMRTYERGVEGETLACGTGAVASAAVLAASGQIDLPWVVVTSSGRRLEINGTARFEPLGLDSPRLTGEARCVFKAVLNG